MKNPLVALLFTFSAASNLLAGGINVVHLGPRDVLKFQVSADGATQDFTLAHGASSGPFMLPDKPSAIKGYIDKVPSLDIPASEGPRLAVLTTAEKGYEWHLIDGKPTPEKWGFRIINLTQEPAAILSGKAEVEIPAGGEAPVDIAGKSDIRVKMAGALNLKYKGSEPCSVIAFLYRENGTWTALFVPDR